MDRYVCVHGHFYQPPRENPWLEDVEVQDSAHPFHNWNERVTFECYAPNTASRVLGAGGRIVDIVNNYRKISFNFGPTLLSWLERRVPEVHAKLVEADRLSAADRSGHGNALAQVYNHLIMPLASRRDKETQVRWGVADFRRRFGRDPEGMWLAETAVDGETLEVLAEHGIKFTVLSPFQAEAVRPAGEDDWRSVQGGKVDPSRGYRWTSPSGRSLALFFYDAPISHAVAFEGVLNDGAAFAERLMGGFSDDRSHAQLVHIATDGESYGHHHRFGDMALAYALGRVESEPGVRLTNYGEYLEKHPPEWEARIVERSAWSCAHGVERWNSDCGCRIGNNGWHQAWRSPLRRALDGLRDGLDVLYEKHAPALLRDPWAARDAYIGPVLDRSAGSIEAFFRDQQARPLGPEERTAALKLLEAQRQRMLMYTSCAWFFDEVSGIETAAVLCFAARALQLVRDRDESAPLERDFLSALTKAPSNLPALGDGGEVYRRFVTPVVTDLPRIAAHQAIESLFTDPPEEAAVYCYRVSLSERDRVSSGGTVLSMGRIRVLSEVTGESMETSFAALHLGGHDIQCVLKSFPDPARRAEVKESLLDRAVHGSLPEVLSLLYRTFGDRVYSVQDLLLEERRRLLESLTLDVVGRYDPIYRALVDDNRKLIRMLVDAGVPVPPAFRLALHYVLGRDMDRCMADLRRDPRSEGGAPRRLLALREDAVRFGLPLDWDKAARLLRHNLEDRMRSLRSSGFNPVLARDILTLLELGEKLELKMNLWRLENDFFDLSRGPLRQLQGEDLRLASALGERLRFPPLSQPLLHR